MSSPEVEKLSYSIAEVAQATGLSRARIYQLVAAGTLPAVNLLGTRRMLIQKRDLVAFLDSLPRTNASAHA
jgi:excisionase family DNA binding protein